MRHAPAPALQIPVGETASIAGRKCCILDSSGSLRSFRLVLLREPNPKYRASAQNLIWTGVVSNPPFCVAETRHHMVIDHAHSLHKRVTNRGAGELEAAAF